MSLLRAAGLALVLAAACSVPAAAARGKAAPRADAGADERLYQTGVSAYAAGDLPAALAAFRAVLKSDPNNALARSAVRRLERESLPAPSSRPVASIPVRRASVGAAVDRFILVLLPRWFYFERTLGDSVSDVGTLSAINARIVQLLGERKMAFAENRPFAKEAQLRALLRRTPAVAQEFEQV